MPVDGADVLAFPEREKDHFRSAVIARISQDDDLIPGLSVYDNCALADCCPK